MPLPPALRSDPCPPSERAVQLDETRWARDFTWQEIEQLAQFLHRYTATADAVVVSEGGAERFLAILLHGRVSVERRDTHDRPQRLTVLGPGHTFGEMSLLDGEPRSATVRAMTDVMLLVLTPESFAMLVEQQPRVAVRLVTQLATLLSARLRQTTWGLLEALSVAEAVAPTAPPHAL